MKFDHINLLLLAPAGRSGSAFTQSLFDGHEAFISLPFLHDRYNYFKIFKGLNFSFKRFVQLKANVFDPRLNYFNQGGVEKFSNNNFNLNLDQFADFCNNFLDFKITNNKDFLIFIHLAWAAFNNKDIGKIKYIFFHHHQLMLTPSLFIKIKQDFPSVHVLITCRHPIEGVSRWKEELIHRGHYSHWTLLCDAGNAVKSYQSAVLIKKYLGGLSKKCFRLLDLNDFHLHSKKILDKLCAWLQIDYSTVLETSTVLGVIWQGNSSDGKKISSFSRQKAELIYPKSVGKEKGLTLEEYAFLSHKMKACCYAFGYHDPLYQKYPRYKFSFFWSALKTAYPKDRYNSAHVPNIFRYNFFFRLIPGVLPIYITKLYFFSKITIENNRLFRLFKLYQYFVKGNKLFKEKVSEFRL